MLNIPSAIIGSLIGAASLLIAFFQKDFEDFITFIFIGLFGISYSGFCLLWHINQTYPGILKWLKHLLFI